eukprot:jgi/Mesvir1/2006/Mv06191-RA.1
MPQARPSQIDKSGQDALPSLKLDGPSRFSRPSGVTRAWRSGIEYAGKVQEQPQGRASRRSTTLSAGSPRSKSERSNRSISPMHPHTITIDPGLGVLPPLESPPPAYGKGPSLQRSARKDAIGAASELNRRLQEEGLLGWSPGHTGNDGSADALRDIWWMVTGTGSIVTSPSGLKASTLAPSKKENAKPPPSDELPTTTSAAAIASAAAVSKHKDRVNKLKQAYTIYRHCLTTLAQQVSFHCTDRGDVAEMMLRCQNSLMEQRFAQVEEALEGIAVVDCHLAALHPQVARESSERIAVARAKLEVEKELCAEFKQKHAGTQMAAAVTETDFQQLTRCIPDMKAAQLSLKLAVEEKEEALLATATQVEQLRPVLVALNRKVEAMHKRNDQCAAGLAQLRTVNVGIMEESDELRGNLGDTTPREDFSSFPPPPPMLLPSTPLPPQQAAGAGPPGEKDEPQGAAAGAGKGGVDGDGDQLKLSITAVEKLLPLPGPAWGPGSEASESPRLGGDSPARGGGGNTPDKSKGKDGKPGGPRLAGAGRVSFAAELSGADAAPESARSAGPLWGGLDEGVARLAVPGLPMVEVMPPPRPVATTTQEHVAELEAELEMLNAAIADIQKQLPDIPLSSLVPSGHGMPGDPYSGRTPWWKAIRTSMPIDRGHLPGGTPHFVGLGMAADIPPFLRTHALVENTSMTKRETEVFIKGLWKAKNTQDRAEGRVSDLSDFLHSYLLTKHGGNTAAVIETAYNLMAAVQRYQYDADCELFFQVLTGELGEGVRTAQLAIVDQYRERLEQLPSVPMTSEDVAERSIRLTRKDSGRSMLATGHRVSKAGARQVLADMFAHKSARQLEALFVALDRVVQEKAFFVEQLFYEDDDFNETPLVEALRDQFLEERREYLNAVAAAIMDVTMGAVADKGKGKGGSKGKPGGGARGRQRKEGSDEEGEEGEEDDVSDEEDVPGGAAMVMDDPKDEPIGDWKMQLLLSGSVLVSVPQAIQAIAMVDAGAPREHLRECIEAGFVQQAQQQRNAGDPENLFLGTELYQGGVDFSGTLEAAASAAVAGAGQEEEGAAGEDASRAARSRPQHHRVSVATFMMSFSRNVDAASPYFCLNRKWKMAGNAAKNSE